MKGMLGVVPRWLGYALRWPGALGWGRKGLATRPAGDLRRYRALAAAMALNGEGIEVGPLNEPLRLPPWARARYVDRLPLAELRAHYPELDGTPLVDPDILDDGETLGSIGDGSVDFVVANHFLEHCQSPITALATFCRVVRPGGTVYLAIPDKRFTFDETRPITPFEHVARDHEEGPEWSRRAHYEEVVRVTEKLRGAEAEARLESFLSRAYSIHFHVWDHHACLDMLTTAQKRYALPYELALALRNGMESIFVLQRA
jgi:SAM-dependent methyltransferase